MLPLYLELTELVIDRVGLKYIFFNYVLSSCLVSILILFLITFVNTTSPRLTIGAILSLLTLLVVNLTIECAHQIIFWMHISRDPASLLGPHSSDVHFA